MKRPLIGITCGQDVSPTGAKRSYQNTSYVNAVIQAGGTPLLIPLSEDMASLADLYDRLDGLLLSGGGDVEPCRYGQEPHEKLGPTDPLRDHVEMALTKWAVDDGLPLLAICRGIQVLNVAMGGTLIQDISSLVQKALVHPYQPGNPRDHLAHGVEIRANSTLGRMLSQQVMVNSMHHQAVERVAPGFRVTARASDGVIEAIEHTGLPFVVGVQWHPEEMVGKYPAMGAIFEGFVQACSSAQEGQGYPEGDLG